MTTQKDPHIESSIATIGTISQNSERRVESNLFIQTSRVSPGKNYQEDSSASTLGKKNQQEIQNEAPHEDGFDWSRVDTRFSPDRFSDEDFPKVKAARTITRCAVCIDWYKRWPYFLRILLYAITGSSILLIPGLISYFFFIEDRDVSFTSFKAKNGQFQIDGIPIFLLSTFLSIMWSVWWLLKWFATVLPDILASIFELVLGIKVRVNTGPASGRDIDHYLDYLRFLSKYMAFTAWALVGLVLQAILFKNFGNVLWVTYLDPIWRTAFAAGMVWCIGKYLLRIFTVRFHKRAFAGRMEGSNYAYSVLESLNKACKNKNRNRMAGAVPQDVNWNANANADDSVFFDKKKQGVKIVNNLGKTAAGVSKHIVKGLSHVVSAAVGVELGRAYTINLRSPQDAANLARKLFEALCTNAEGYITSSDFEPYFKSSSESNIAFALFDKDDNGDISRPEMKAAVHEIFRERMALERSLEQAEQAIDKLDSLLKAVLLIILLFVSLSIWGVNTTTFIASAATLWAGLMLAIGGTVKSLVESCVFLFMTHPYDVGDRVDIEKDSYIVKEFGLTSTVFRRIDGKEIYAPNSVLLTKFIHNVRRSGNQSEHIHITVPIETSEEAILDLKQYLLSFVKVNSRDYLPSLDMGINSFDGGGIEIRIQLKHKSNWQDEQKRKARRGKFMFALRDGLSKYNIKLVDPSNLNVQMMKNNLAENHDDKFLYDNNQNNRNGRDDGHVDDRPTVRPRKSSYNWTGHSPSRG